MLRELSPVVAAIALHDKDLATPAEEGIDEHRAQLQRGEWVMQGGTRRERYQNALGSARETGACLDAALALGYLEAVDASLLDKLDHVRATVLVKNVR